MCTTALSTHRPPCKSITTIATKLSFNPGRTPIHFWNKMAISSLVCSQKFDHLLIDVLLEVVSHLDPPSQICLALTSHKYKEFVLDANGKAKLKQIITDDFVYSPQGTLMMEQEALMRLLESWMPKGYILCSMCSDRYVRISIVTFPMFLCSEATGQRAETCMCHTCHRSPVPAWRRYF